MYIHYPASEKEPEHGDLIKDFSLCVSEFLTAELLALFLTYKVVFWLCGCSLFRHHIVDGKDQFLTSFCFFPSFYQCASWCVWWLTPGGGIFSSPCRLPCMWHVYMCGGFFFMPVTVNSGYIWPPFLSFFFTSAFSILKLFCFFGGGVWTFLFPEPNKGRHTSDLRDV